MVVRGEKQCLHAETRVTASEVLRGGRVDNKSKCTREKAFRFHKLPHIDLDPLLSYVTNQGPPNIVK